MSNIEKQETAISIYNPADKLEVAVKQNLSEGENYKSWNVVYRSIGFGDLRGGEQKRRAKEQISQYAMLTPTGRTKYELYCEEIFLIPNYLEKIDGRGKKGFYIDRVIPLILFLLLNQSNDEMRTSVQKLAIQIGIVNGDYRNLPSDDTTLKALKNHHLKISDSVVNTFYYSCQEELGNIIYRALDRLQDECSVLDYEKTFLIKTVEENLFPELIEGETIVNSSIATPDQRVIIRNAERVVLNEMGYKTKCQMYMRKKGEKFEKKVISLINEQNNWNMVQYRPQILISFTPDLVRQFLKDHYPDFNHGDFRIEINQRFQETMQKKMVRIVNYTNKYLNECIDKEMNLYAKNKDIAELLEIGFRESYREDIANRKRWEFRYGRMKKGKKPLYFYYPDFLPKQDYLISRFIK